jgi:hypothetical protein
VREIAWAVEQRILWRVADLMRGAAEVVRWPFDRVVWLARQRLERILWLAEQRLVWPVEERVDGLSTATRATAGGGLAALAAAAMTVGIVLATGSGGEGHPVPGQSPVAVVSHTEPAPATPSNSGRVLHGPPPSFGIGAGVGVSKSAGGSSGAEDTPTATALPDATGAEGEDGGATTSSAKSVPAGPVAMKVARRFSEAFVYYEIGERKGRARAVFEETAAPRLANALAGRPPRLPASADVPKARVLNLVPGPRRGKAYTVSVSLLRVGVTSELRLDLMKQGDAWLVTDVRG